MSGQYQPRNGLTKARSESRIDRATQIKRSHRSIGIMANRLNDTGIPHRQKSHYDSVQLDTQYKKTSQKQPPHDTTTNGYHTSPPAVSRDQPYDTTSSTHQPQRSRSSSPPIHTIPSSTIYHGKTPPSSKDRYQQRPRSRSPSPEIPIQVLTYTNRYRPPASSSQNRLPQVQQSRSRSRSRSRSPSKYPEQPTKPLSRTRSPSSSSIARQPSPPKHPQQYEQSTSRDSTKLAPSSLNISRKSRNQQQMVTRETGTHLDIMKIQQHRGEQTESLSKKDIGTTPKSDTKQTSQIVHLTPSTTKQTFSYSPISNLSLLKHDYISTPPHQNNIILLENEPPSTQKTFLLRPTSYRNDAGNYEEQTSKYDEKVLSAYKPNVDHRHEYTPKQDASNHFSFDRHIPEEDKHVPTSKQYAGHEDSYITELANQDFTVIPTTNAVQPATISRQHDRYQSPSYRKQDDRHAHQHQITTRTDSPILNIGAERIIRDSLNSEFAESFEVNYVPEPNRDFRLQPRKKNILLLPVLNSSRTYVFEKQSIRQSNANGNFYLATSPALRPFN